MIEIKNLSIKVNNRYLVKNLSFTMNEKDKLAIIREEGNGKSTLIKEIYKILNKRTDINVGYMPQNYADI